MFKNIIALLLLVILTAPAAMAASKVYQISEGLDNNSQIMMDPNGIIFVSENRTKKEFSLKTFGFSDGNLDAYIMKKDPIRLLRGSYFFSLTRSLNYVLNTNQICRNQECFAIDSSKLIGDAISAGSFLIWIQYDNDAIYLKSLQADKLKDPNAASAVVSYKLSDNDGSRYIIVSNHLIKTVSDLALEEVVSLFRIKPKTYMKSAGKDIFSYNLGYGYDTNGRRTNLEWRLDGNATIKTPEIVDPIFMKMKFEYGQTLFWSQGGVTNTDRQLYSCEIVADVCTPRFIATTNPTVNKTVVFDNYSPRLYAFSNGTGLKFVDALNNNILLTIKTTIDAFDYFNGHLAYISNGQVYYQDINSSKSRILSIRVNDIENQLSHSGNVGIAK